MLRAGETPGSDGTIRIFTSFLLKIISPFVDEGIAKNGSPMVIGHAGGCHDFEGFIDEVTNIFFLIKIIIYLQRDTFFKVKTVIQ